MKIYAPVKDFNGLRGSVRFVNGVGETNDPHLIEWFRKNGYRVPVEECGENHTFSVEKCESVVNDSEFVNLNKLAEEDPDFESMTPNELREWAKANGLGTVIKNTRNKEKLLEIIEANR